MKNGKVVAGMFAALLALNGAVNAEENDAEFVSKELVSLASFDQDTLQNLQAHFSEIIVEVTEGAEIPVTLLLGGVAAVTEDANVPTVRVLESFYVQKEENKVLFSADCETWEPAMSFLATNQVLELSEEMVAALQNSQLLNTETQEEV